jgi:hypothetical protein
MGQGACLANKVYCIKEAMSENERKTLKIIYFKALLNLTEDGQQRRLRKVFSLWRNAFSFYEKRLKNMGS